MEDEALPLLDPVSDFVLDLEHAAILRSRGYTKGSTALS